MSYDITTYAADEGCAYLRTRISWTPSDGGEAVTATSDYVNGGGGLEANLCCGLEAALADLGLPQFEDTAHYVRVCDLVDRQLAQRPWAVLVCPQGTARLELVTADA